MIITLFRIAGLTFALAIPVADMMSDTITTGFSQVHTTWQKCSMVRECTVISHSDREVVSGKGKSEDEQINFASKIKNFDQSIDTTKGGIHLDSGSGQGGVKIVEIFNSPTYSLPIIGMIGPAAWRQCNKDSDCTVIPFSCSGREAVNHNYKPQAEQLIYRTESAAWAACNVPASAGMTAACRNNQCEVHLDR